MDLSSICKWSFWLLLFLKINFTWFLARWFSFILTACAICIHDLYFRCFSGKLCSLPCICTLKFYQVGVMRLSVEVYSGSILACLALAHFNFASLQCGLVTVFVTRTSNWNRETWHTKNRFSTLETFFYIYFGLEILKTLPRKVFPISLDSTCSSYTIWS